MPRGRASWTEGASVETTVVGPREQRPFRPGLYATRAKYHSYRDRAQRLFKTGSRLIRHARYFTLQLAESYLTESLFRQILQRIERRAWHPTWSRPRGVKVMTSEWRSE